MSKKPRSQDPEPATNAPEEPSAGDSERLRQQRLLADAREDFLAEVPLLSADEVEQLLGSPATRLMREGKVLALSYGGMDLYPAAQFVGDRVHPAFAEVLAAFGEGSGWTVALWLRAPSGWLGGKRPLDLIQDEPDRVVEAARRTAAPIAF